MKFGCKERVAVGRGYRVDGLTVIGPKGVMSPWLGREGYPSISIGRGEKCRVHRLVAFQRWGEMIYRPGTEVRHLDGNKMNFLLDNIMIGTHSENMMDVPHERRALQAAHAASFRRCHDKEAVRDFYEGCRSYRKTMEHFRITSKGTLHWLLNSPISIPITVLHPSHVFGETIAPMKRHLEVATNPKTKARK